MGFENCTAVEKVPKESKYFFKQMEYDINNGSNDDMKERCKIEVKISNVSSGSCKISLVQYTDNTRKTILKKEGETETASVNSSNSIAFSKLFYFELLFRKRATY